MEELLPITGHIQVAQVNFKLMTQVTVFLLGKGKFYFTILIIKYKDLCLCKCLPVPKDLANIWTDMVLLLQCSFSLVLGRLMAFPRDIAKITKNILKVPLGSATIKG